MSALDRGAPGPGTLGLVVGGQTVAQYSDGTDMAAVDSPRPYLFSVRTLGGVELTETATADHHHHYGVSLALPDVDGTSHWGGRTYVRETGSTLLENHGRQQVSTREPVTGGCREHVELLDPAGALQLTDERSVTVSAVAGVTDGWRLDWRSSLSTASDEVTLGSPQTNGRDGAFYGGLFWRTPFTGATALVEEGTGTDLAHGSRSPWLAITTPDSTIVAATTTGMPWFVRTEGYVGFGPAVAFDERRRILPGSPLRLDLSAIVVDEGDIDQARAAELAALLLGPTPSAAAPATRPTTSAASHSAGEPR